MHGWTLLRKTHQRGRICTAAEKNSIGSLLSWSMHRTWPRRSQLLPVDRTLQIRLIAPEQFRIDRFSRLQKITPAEAKRQIAEIDQGRDDFVRSYFHKDPTDPNNYDVVLNTARLSKDACVATILSALGPPQ